MRLLVIGHARHGKDTVCEIIANRYGLKFVSSSVFVGRAVLFDRIGSFYRERIEDGPVKGWASNNQIFDAMFADRSNHRALWRDLIAQYCAEDPARTASEMLAQGYDMYCGMRARREFEAARKMFDAVIWVDRSEHLPPEPIDSMELIASDADIFLDNNGTLYNLEHQVDLAMARVVRLIESRIPTHESEPQT